MKFCISSSMILKLRIRFILVQDADKRIVALKLKTTSKGGEIDSNESPPSDQAAEDGFQNCDSIDDELVCEDEYFNR